MVVFKMFVLEVVKKVSFLLIIISVYESDLKNEFFH